MPKFRLREPLIVEAHRVPEYGPFNPKASSSTIDEWARLWVFLGPGASWEVADDLGVDVENVDGVIEHARPGDWIAKNEWGIFAATPEEFERRFEGYDA